MYTLIIHKILTKQEPKEAELIQRIKYVEPKKTSISSGQGSNEIYVIDVENVVGEERSDDMTSNAKDQTSTSSTGINQISNRLFINVFNANLVDFPYLDGLLGIAMIVVMALLTLALTWWPQHNVILSPEYWYEPIPIVSVLWAVYACTIFLRAKILMNTEKFMVFKSVSQLFVVIWLGNTVVFVSIYYLWTKYLGFPHPMPETGSICYLLTFLLVVPLATWFMFPTEFKAHGHPCRKQIFSFIVLFVLRIVMAIGYNKIPKLPLIKHETWQLSLGILFPACKKFNMWWNSKFTR